MLLFFYRTKMVNALQYNKMDRMMLDTGDRKGSPYRDTI